MYCGTRLTRGPAGPGRWAQGGMGTMLALEPLAPGISLVGVDPTFVVTVVAVVPIGEAAVQLVYKTADGALQGRLLIRGRRAEHQHRHADNACAVKIASADETHDEFEDGTRFIMIGQTASVPCQESAR